MSIYEKGRGPVQVRKPSVKTAEAGLSPHTQKLIAQNKKIIDRTKKPGMIGRLKEIL